jgi:hypothetical protein
MFVRSQKLKRFDSVVFNMMLPFLSLLLNVWHRHASVCTRCRLFPCITRHTSHVTRYTSHVRRHTLLASLHTCLVQIASCITHPGIKRQAHSLKVLHTSTTTIQNPFKTLKHTTPNTAPQWRVSTLQEGRNGLRAMKERVGGQQLMIVQRAQAVFIRRVKEDAMRQWVLLVRSRCCSPAVLLRLRLRLLRRVVGRWRARAKVAVKVRLDGCLCFLRHTGRITTSIYITHRAHHNEYTRVTLHACIRQNCCSHLQRNAARHPQSRFPPHFS